MVWALLWPPPPSSAENKNGWSHTSTTVGVYGIVIRRTLLHSHIRLHRVHWDICTCIYFKIVAFERKSNTEFTWLPFCFMFYKTRFNQVALLTCTWKVLGSCLIWHTDYPCCLIRVYREDFLNIFWLPRWRDFWYLRLQKFRHVFVNMFVGLLRSRGGTRCPVTALFARRRADRRCLFALNPWIKSVPNEKT